jgi:CheY-like chemotaxis protein
MPDFPATASELESLRHRVEELEAQLAQTQKMHAIGSLAGGVAHDFNNLLTAILGYVSLLKEDAAGQNFTEALDVIEKAADRASQLTAQLLGFARRGQPKRVRVDMHQVLNEVIDLLRYTIDRNIRMERRFSATVPYVMGDPSQMFQVFLNLALNARDAMPYGGVLILGTESVDPWVRVTVTDTGTGVPDQIRDRIFEPFFTTKEPDKGTGMGLTVVQGIVRAHGGQIELEPAADFQGSCFTVSLLVSPERSLAATTEIPSAIRGKGSILVVDDEEVVRQVAARMLKSLGYQVICIGTAQEALDYYQRRIRDIDLIVVDLIMPDMSGKAVFERLREINPRARIVISSGYNQDASIEALIGAGARGFLQKPYRLNQLSAALGDAMIP